MTRGEFIESTEKIYQAIRKVYGYDDEAEKIMDAFDELVDAWERDYNKAD